MRSKPKVPSDITFSRSPLYRNPKHESGEHIRGKYTLLILREARLHPTLCKFNIIDLSCSKDRWSRHTANIQLLSCFPTSGRDRKEGAPRK